MDLLSIGLILVGAVLALKVITEGRTQIADLTANLHAYEAATQQNTEKVEQQEAQNSKTKADVEKLRLDLDTLKSERRDMRHKTSQLQAELGKPRKASDLF